MSFFFPFSNPFSLSLISSLILVFSLLVLSLIISLALSLVISLVLSLVLSPVLSMVLSLVHLVLFMLVLFLVLSLPHSLVLFLVLVPSLLVVFLVHLVLFLFPADYLTALVRVSVTIEDPSSEPPFELALDLSEQRAREIIRETAVTHTTSRSAWEVQQVGVNREHMQHVRSERLVGSVLGQGQGLGPGSGLGQGRDDVDFTQDVMSQARAQGLTLTAVFLQITEALRANPHVVRCTLGMLPELLRQTTVSMSVAHEDAVREVIIRSEAVRGSQTSRCSLLDTHL